MRDRPDALGGEGRAVLPDPVGDFLIDFDAGLFPTLERAVQATGAAKTASGSP